MKYRKNNKKKEIVYLQKLQNTILWAIYYQNLISTSTQYYWINSKKHRKLWILTDSPTNLVGESNNRVQLQPHKAGHHGISTIFIDIFHDFGTYPRFPQYMYHLHVFGCHIPHGSCHRVLVVVLAFCCSKCWKMGREHVLQPNCWITCICQQINCTPWKSWPAC